jgi:hypothetical protein
VPETVAVELTPARIEVEPGARPVEASIGLKNLGGVVSQYTVEVADLEPDWFTVPVPSVGLFPQDREQVRITFHPPKRPNLRSGEYPFRILIRGRGGVQEQSAEGVLDVRGFAVYRLDLQPRRLTDHSEGEFKLVVSNTGTADIKLELEARDEEDTCAITFPKGDLIQVDAGSRVTVPFVVRPRQRAWVGPDKTHTVSLTARPQEARGLPQNISAQYTHRPYLGSWEPVWNVARVAGIGVAILAVILLLFFSPIGGALMQRGRIVLGPACVQTVGNIPLFGRAICSAITLSMPLNISGPGGARTAQGATAAVAAPAPTTAPCDYTFGFKDFSDTFPLLVGGCSSVVQYDVFGNNYQSTSGGMLIWQKATNRIFFMSGSRTYEYSNGTVQVVNGLPGA